MIKMIVSSSSTIMKMIALVRAADINFSIQFVFRFAALRSQCCNRGGIYRLYGNNGAGKARITESGLCVLRYLGETFACLVVVIGKYTSCIQNVIHVNWTSFMYRPFVFVLHNVCVFFYIDKVCLLVCIEYRGSTPVHWPFKKMYRVFICSFDEKHMNTRS